MIGNTRGILGDKGTCKSVLLGYLAKVTVDMGGIAITNFSCTFPHVKVPFKDLVKHIGKTVDGCDVPSDPRLPCEHGFYSIFLGAAIFTDELGKGADSYEFFSTQNKKLSELSFEIRKYGALWYWAAQRKHTVTTRIRGLTDCYLLLDFMEVDSDIDGPILPDQIDDKPFDLEKPYMYTATLKLVHKAQSVITLTDQDGETAIWTQDFDGRPFVDLINTHEVIAA